MCPSLSEIELSLRLDYGILMLDSMRLNFESVGANAITGVPSVIRAIGPCFSSPPGIAIQEDI